MKIDKTNYKLASKNFFEEKSDKTKILLTDSRSALMTHYLDWLNKSAVTGYKRTTHFSIRKTGGIIQHFPVDCYSSVFDLPHIDKQIISISLENMGWLTYDKRKKTYNNWCGDIYREDNVFVKSWRGHLFWDSYSKEQSEALSELIVYLCDNYGINKRMVDNTLYFEYAENFEGVLTRPNFSRLSTDINPSLDLDEISKKIET
jgi:hypothetical protein